MAFDLPRSPRSLRFTGEVRSLACPAPEEPLAQQRPRLPSSNGIDTPTRMKLETPNTIRGGMLRSLPSLESEDDDDADRETLFMDRSLDIALLPDARLAMPQPGVPQLPVPGFRSRDDVLRQEQAALYAPRPAPTSGRFPLGVWLIASLVLAITSFFAAPVARDTVQAALRTTAQR